MKNIIFIFFFLHFFISINCQEWQYSAVINGTGIEPKYSTTDQQGNIYILSQFLGSISNPSLTSYGATDVFLCKLSSSGTLLWYDHIGNTGADLPGGLTISEGFLYVTGAYNSTCNFYKGSFQLSNTGNGDIYLAKYDLNGEFQFAKRIGAHPTNQSSTHLKADNNNHLLMTGYFRDSVIIGNSPVDQVTLKGTTGIVSNFIANLDLDGNCIWAKSYLGTSTLTRFQRIGISENGYYFGGYYQGNFTFDIGTISSYAPTTYDAFLYKTDFAGNGQWVRRIRGLSTENFRTLTTDEFDNVYILGNYNSNTLYIDSTTSSVKTFLGNSGGYDTYLAKYNRSGTLQWFLTKGSSAKDIYNDFVIRNNIIYATGYFANQIIFNNDTLRTSDPLNEDAFLAAFNQIGDPISGISIKGTGNYNDAGTIVRMDANSRAYVAGYFKSQQIQIGNQIYTSADVNVSDQFFAVFKQPFKAVITDEQMVSCNGLSDGMLTVTPYFGRPPYTYSWSHNPSLNSNIAENLPAGDYTVTVTDANDSITNITGHVSQSPTLDITGVITPVSCFNGNDGEINITASGGSGTYDYFWTSLDGSGLQPLIEDQSGLSKGTFSIRVLDQNNCKDSTAFVVTEPSRFNYTGTVTTKIIIPPGNNGSIDLNPAGGNAPYTFAWTGPNGYTASTEDIGNLADAGLYNLHLTDTKNCVSDTTFTVIDNFTFVAEISAKTDVKCFGADDGTATVRVLNGTPPYSYQWSDGVTLSDSIRTGMQPGLYVVTVTDGALKTSQASVRIDEPSMALSIVMDADDLQCFGDNSGIVDVTVSGGVLPYSFSWNNGYTGEDLVNVPAEIYTVTVTDAAGCQVQDTREVYEPQRIGLIITQNGDILCHNDNTANAVANATGGTPPGSFDYLWDDPGNQITPTAYDLKAGTYHCTVTDSNKCSVAAEIIIDEPDTLSVDVAITIPSCAGAEDGAIIPTPIGGTGPGFEYIWSNGVYERFNDNIAAGTYILTMNDANNCTITDTFNLADPDTVKITLIDVTDVSCLGKTDGSADIHATGGTGVYEFSNDDGTTFGTGSIFSNLEAGNYTIVVRDENDCLSESNTITIVIADTVVIDSLRTVDATCAGLNNGTIAIVANGGSGSYEYSDDGGLTFENESGFASLAAGNYSVMVRDNNDCRSEEMPVTIINTDTIRITSLDFSDLTCSGIPDGTITITASGGTGEFTYSVDGGNNFGQESLVGSLSQGDYVVLVKDGNDCLSEEGNVTLHAADVCAMVIYDAFSPNDDDKNDVWNIGNVGSYPSITVKIYNIWGKEVFTSKGYGTPWDGTWNGKNLPSGTYYYVIDPGDGSDIITGDVSIVK